MPQREHLFLLGDIGGTKARLAIYDPVESQIKIQRIFQSREFSSIDHLLTSFLKSVSSRPEYAILALAGPVIKGKVTMTNLGWKVDSKALKKNFKFKKVTLINDLQAIACSIFLLSDQDLFPARVVESIRKYPKAFMAPGTGLGVSVLVSRNPLRVMATEAGHVLFTPLDDEEWGFSQFLRDKGILPVWEEVLSGRGLSNLYEFFYKKQLSPEEIVSFAMKGDYQARKIVAKYLGLLGRKSYEIALSFEPFGGIFLAGGLILAMKTFLEKEEMRREFFSGYFCNEKLKELLSAIPIFLILHPHPGLLGVQTIVHIQSK